MSVIRFEETAGTAGFGEVIISQPRRGYRFTSDAVALVEFTRINSWESLLDFGTGVGVIPLLVWQRNPFRFALGIELQKDLADLARENVRANALSKKIFILQSDLRTLTLKNIRLPEQTPTAVKFDVITANPPYLALGRGRVNPNPQKALARHEIRLTFSELVAACRRFLKPEGRFYFVHLAQRETDLAATLRAHQFTILSQQYTSGKGRKTLLLAEARLQPDDTHCS
jgi:tRNA1Val (adenine37-N6)-methyltransferase